MGEVVASTEAVVEVTTNLLLPLPVEAMDVEEVDIDHLLHMMEDVRVDLVEEEVRRTKLSCYTYTKIVYSTTSFFFYRLFFYRHT